MRVCITVDLEHDCPPYCSTWRGMEEGAPALYRLLREERVPATFFTMGVLARRYPRMIEQILLDGHELGCHGDQHLSFKAIDEVRARHDLEVSTTTLRSFGRVISFRAPYLAFPRRYLSVLEELGYQLDSSEGRHKSLGARVHRSGGLLRIPASVTSSTLRWPASVRNLLLAHLADPVVLFVHPWEFVNLTNERLRFDCRFRTGQPALDCLRSVIALFKSKEANFLRMSSLLPEAEQSLNTGGFGVFDRANPGSR